MKGGPPKQCGWLYVRSSLATTSCPRSDQGPTLQRNDERGNAHSREDRFHHVARDVSQAEIAAVEAIGELGVVKAHALEDRRVQVVDMDLVLHCGRTEFVGG